AMAGCLACKSCAGQCPVKVNVPEFRSRFLELYHQRYLRPLRDYLIGSLEFTMPWMARVPALYNGLMGAGFTFHARITAARSKRLSSGLSTMPTWRSSSVLTQPAPINP
ncbi:(Fe-S)-binding protein, partial [Burkholderia cenocepacia]|uniref:(Fe-S)-binding protein n=1 Tax=Burkholderia cenocepacia TaxID=95486 RepID=UPI0024B69ECC